MHNIMLNAPVESGQFMSLKDCGEAPFVNGAMGRGAAVSNTSGRIISPFSGRVLKVFRNAISIVSNNERSNLFIQVGDNGFYECCVRENQTISYNQILAYFNIKKIVMFTVKNDAEFGDITFQLGGQNYTIKGGGNSAPRANNSTGDDNMAEETQGSRFTILGETGSGKTCYLLGMYYEMSMGEAGYTVVTTNDEDDSKLAERYERLKDKSRGQSRFPDPTDQSQKYNFVLAYNYERIAEFEWVDYPGGWLDVRNRNKINPEQYNEVKKSILKSDTLFICIDGENLVGSNTKAKIRNVATKCARNINPYLTELKKEAKGFPPIVIIVTKYDMCMNDTDADEIKEIVQHDKVLGGLFKYNDTIIAVIPVSLGDTLMDDSYSGDLDPINISLPILFGVNFALIDMICYGKHLVEEHQKLKEENQRELDWARNQKRIEDNRWGITRWFFGGYDPDQLQQGIYEVEQNIHEIEQAIKNIREIAGYFKQSSQRINRELEAIDLLFVNGAWQNGHGRRRFWNDVQSVANYF